MGVLGGARRLGTWLLHRVALGEREREAIRRSPFDLAELFLAWSAVVAGLIILNPLAETFRSSAAFGPITVLPVPEWGWGLAVFALGMGQRWAYNRDRRAWRHRLMFGALAWWAFEGLMLVIGNAAGQGAWDLLFRAAVAGILRWRMSADWRGAGG